MKFSWLFLLAFFSVTQPVLGRVLFVEKDGSGDYSNLQAAANAASSGDTLRIGPGRFDDIGSSECLGQHLQNPYRLTVQVAELTIIGAGADSTIIGPEEWNPDWQVGILVVGDCGNRRLIIRDIRFENLGDCISAIRGQRIDIESCSFYNFNRGLTTNSNHARIADCYVETNRAGSIFVVTATGWNNDTLEIINTQSVIGVSQGKPMLGGADFTLINNCTFDGGSGMFFGGGALHVESSSLLNSKRGIGANSGHIQVEDSTFTGVKYGIWLDNSIPNVELMVQGCVFSDIEITSFSYQSFQSGFIRDCLLEKGEQYVVGVNNSFNYSQKTFMKPELIPNMGPEKLYYSVSVQSLPAAIDNSNYHFDMTDNWWGTTDPDSIQAWILDGTDMEDWDYFIDWAPYKDESVGTEKVSSGSFKAMFR